MLRGIISKCLLTCLVLVFFSASMVYGGIWWATGPSKTAARNAPVFMFPDETGLEPPPPPKTPGKMTLRAPFAGQNPQTIGRTTFDYQQNCTMGRQVEHRAGYSNPPTPYGLFIDFAWTAATGDTLAGSRGVGYQAYRISGCDTLWPGGGERIEPAYSGSVSLDAHNINPASSWAIPAAHVSQDGMSARTFWDFKPFGPHFGVFSTEYPIDRFGYGFNHGTGMGNENIWPKIEWDIDGADYVLHMVCTEKYPQGTPAGMPQTCSYYRRVGPYGAGEGAWSGQRVIDTVMNINVTVASSPISEKVAVVWNAPVDYKRDTYSEFRSQYENDVWFAIADDNGATWADDSTKAGFPSIGNTVDLGNGGGYNINTGGNLTTYSDTSSFKAYCDLSALWSITGDPNDYLQIVWGCRRWTQADTVYRRQGAIFHWNQETDIIRPVVKALWDTGGDCYGHAWGTDAAKMSISECDGKLYVLYTQFGTKANPCGDADLVDFVLNGYLYITAYDPSYSAWDLPVRVTTTASTPTGCTPGQSGDCNSEYWGSMARYGRVDTCKVLPKGQDVLDILYINDYAPGGCVQTESGVWTVNDVNWVVYPCRLAAEDYGYDDNAGTGYGLSVGQHEFVLKTTDDTSFTFTMENPGTRDNLFDITCVIDSGGNGNTTITFSPSTGTIPKGFGAVEVEVTVSTAGEMDSTTVYRTIRVGHWATGGPRLIPICITVSNDYVPLKADTLATPSKQLRVYNNGEISNDGANLSLDFVDDDSLCADIYLFDGSPIVCRTVGTTKKCFFSVFANKYGNDDALIQVSPITRSSTVDYTYSASEFMTADSTIRLMSEYFFPSSSDSSGFVIQKVSYWNLTEDTLYNVAVGEALDFDIPSYPTNKNESGYDASRQLMYQHGCGDDECDTTDANRRYGGVAAWKKKPFRNYMTLDNATYVYTSGPFGNNAPLPADTIYGMMKNLTGFHPSNKTCEDLMTLTTFGVYNMAPNDTQCVTLILTTSRDDADGSALKSNVDMADTFINNHPETQPCLVCDCVPGDANGDGQVNIGDAVYVICYVFKGCTAPTPYPICNCDANGDCSCNVGDAVYVISYVFKGGAPPVSCETWVDNCGLPLRK